MSKLYNTYASYERLMNLKVEEGDIYVNIVKSNPKLNCADLTIAQAQALIPDGPYCYSKEGTCPFWDKISHFPDQENGYCHFLKSGDFNDDGVGLLWDQCKACGVND